VAEIEKLENLGRIPTEPMGKGYTVGIVLALLTKGIEPLPLVESNIKKVWILGRKIINQR